jgi:hypothetical protein
MGVHVHLAVVVDRVSNAAWTDIYDKACRVASQWTPRPLSSAWRQIGAVQVAQYGLEIELADGLHIVGDAASLTTAESFVFPAMLDRAPSLRDRDGSQTASDADVLVAVALRNARRPVPAPPWRHLFGGKTQGLPYHELVVGLGLLVEHALPGTAVVYGDISAHEGEQARRGLASILGKEAALELPVVTDSERLRRRLAGSVTSAVVEQAIRELCPPDPHLDAILGDLLGQMRSQPDARVRYELEHIARSCPDPDRLGTETRLVLRTLVEGIHANVARGEIREQIEQWGAARARESLARQTLRGHVRLSSMAWDAIEAADLDELAFLYVASCVDTRRFEVHHALRALLENRALRQA